MYGVTRERIRQIESKTMSKLRHPSRSQVLETIWTEHLAVSLRLRVKRRSMAFPSPPNPRGVLLPCWPIPARVSCGAANGTAQTAGTFWNEIIDTALQPTLFNETPNAILWSPVMRKYYAKSRLGQPAAAAAADPRSVPVPADQRNPGQLHPGHRDHQHERCVRR